MKANRAKPLLLFIIALFTCVVVLLMINFLKMDRPQLFRRFVLDPIPRSVNGIEADQPKTIGGYGYTFRFKISRADLALIISSHTLSRVHNAEYDSETGYVRFRWSATYGISMPVYPLSGKREPSWFTLETWRRPETYAFRKKQQWQDDTRVLLYNEEAGEAYFLLFNRRG